MSAAPGHTPDAALFLLRRRAAKTGQPTGYKWDSRRAINGGNMNDATTEAPVEQEVTAVTDTQPEAPAQPARTFTQEEVDRLIDAKLVKERSKAESMAAKAREEAERKAAEEQGKYQELYEAAQQKAATLEAQLRAAEIASIKRDVAQRLNMPIALAQRLQGEDEATIEADAKALMAALPKPTPPNINSGTGNGATPTGTAMTEAEKKELAARLGVDWRYLP